MKNEYYFVATGTLYDGLWLSHVGWIDEPWNKKEFLKQVGEGFNLISVKEMTKKEYFAWKEE